EREVKLDGVQQLDAPRERVYQCLIDPQVLQRCIPGCERLEKTGDNTFAATIRTGVGSIKGLFNGTARLEDLREPEHLRIVLDGKGSPGFLKGAGDLNLEAIETGTKVSYSGDVQVGGTIASVGQRMIQGTAKMMATQFFTSLAAEAATAVGDPPPKHGFFRTALRWFSGWLKRLFKATD
ncbi:MAG TPA: carbon monoxide dehydrogenase subunit G, partial [Pyrinomonadaceae bacterium]|nr:carbon monoxide dehydrogenase subunit G [Pyrinomonadaceae bacterium]